jgi:hypothetical protein
MKHWLIALIVALAMVPSIVLLAWLAMIYAHRKRRQS